MRVFMTGASGWVGSEVARQLLARKHTVSGIARSDRSATAMAADGIDVIRGDLADLDTLQSGASASDAVIHCGFIHDFSHYEEAAATDKAAINAIGEVLRGSGKPFLVTSGMAGLGKGRPATESDQLPAEAEKLLPRVSELTALALAADGVRAAVVRLAPSVHGDGDYGFVPAIVAAAKEKGEVVYVGDGGNRWAAVHRTDAARLYVLALENIETGARYHAVGDVGVPLRDIASVIGERLDLPTVSVSAEQAVARVGWIGRFIPIDMAATADLTRERLGWTPTHRDLLTDLREGSYFE